jgi:phenylacetate-CoA ligase
MRRMEKITGRSDDMMIIRGVNVFPSQIEEIILKDSRLSPHFQIELTRSDRLDALTVVVEARPETADEQWAACSDDMASRVKGLIGITVDVRTVKPGSLERSLGKAKRVIDLR